MGGTGVWLKSWVGIVIGLVAIGTAIAGFLTWQYSTFATGEEVEDVEIHAEQNVEQLSEKTLKGFEAVNKTNIQMQRSIRRFDLKDSHKQLLEHKYDLLNKLKRDPDNKELNIDLDLCRSRIAVIEAELKALRISK